MIEPPGRLDFENFLRPKKISRKLNLHSNDSDPVSDYRTLADVFDWAHLLSSNSLENLRLLDVGCGAGRWLDALMMYNPEIKKQAKSIIYSAIDPSQSALDQAERKAKDYFAIGQFWNTRIETALQLPSAHYDIIWSIHSLYALPRPEIQNTISKIQGALHPEGIAIFVLAEKSSFYGEAIVNLTDKERFTCAHDIRNALTNMSLPFVTKNFTYKERFYYSEQSQIGKFVWEESIGNSYPTSITLEKTSTYHIPEQEWFQDFGNGEFYEFPQNTAVIIMRGTPRADRSSALQPSGAEMRHMSDIATQFIIGEHEFISNANAYFADRGPPIWVHTERDQDSRWSEGLLQSILKEPVPETGDGDLEKLLVDTLAPFSRMGTNDNAPGYAAFIPSGGLFHAALAEWIAAGLNRYITTFSASPGFAGLEMLAVNWLLEALGIAKAAKAEQCTPSGVLVSGGASATLHAVHAARLEKGQPSKTDTLVAYLGENAHSSIFQALSICGITHQRLIPIDGQFRMRIDKAEKAIKEDLENGLKPFLLVGTAGDVRTGSVDDLIALRALCNVQDIWFHVDASYGGFFAITGRGRSTLAGLELANSVAVDPHKGLGLPYGTGALLVREEATLRRAFSFSGSYLRPISEDSISPPDLMDLGFEYTRDFRGLRVWLPLKLLGLAPFRKNLELMLDLTSVMAEAFQEIPEIELSLPPVLSICVFRLKSPSSDKENRALLDEINRSGQFFLTGCMMPECFGGGFSIRIALLSFRTDKATVERLIKIIRNSADKIIMRRSR